MLKPLLKIVRFLFFFLFFILGYSQKYPSTHYGIKSGLNNNSVRSILKDSKGIIWIGTDNGINLLKNGELESYEPSIINSSKIWDLKEDSKGTMWVGTYGNGLFKILNDTIFSFTKEKGLTHNHIRKIYLKDDNIFVGTENGLSIINNDSIINPSFKKTKERFQVQDIFEVEDKIYILTFRSGVFELKSNNNKHELIKVRDLDHAFAVGLVGNNLYQSKDGYTNIYKINDFINAGSPSKIVKSSIAWTYTAINDTVAYAANWGVHTDNGGLYEIVNQKISSQNEIYGIKSKSIWSLYYDSEFHFLYVGTLDDGMYRVDLSQNLAFTPKSSKVIDISVDNDVKYILTTKEFVIESQNSLKSVSSEQLFQFKSAVISRKPSLKKARYYDVIEVFNIENVLLNEFQIDSEIIWISTNIGLFKISLEGVIQDYYPIHNESFAIYDDKIFCPVPYYGFQILDKNTYEEIVYLKPSVSSTPLDIRNFVFFKNNILAVSYTKGLFLKNDNTSQFEKIFDKRDLISVTKKSESEIYLAQSDGTVLLYSIKKNKIISTISKNRYKGNTIQFLEYSNNTLIIATEQGINVLTDSTEFLLDEEQGLDELYFTNGRLVNDNLFLSSNQGYYTIKLSKFLNSYKKLNAHISSISINYQEIISKNKYLNLNHDQNTVTLKFDYDYHPYPDKLEFSYKLDNSESWQKLSNREIFLPLLTSGNHNVKLKIKDWHYGRNTTQELATIKIGQSIFQKWWFWVLVGLFSASTIFLIFFIRFKAKAKHFNQLSIVKQQIVETKLEALQSQMNPHFTFNAMNSIQNFIIGEDIHSSLFFLSEFSKLIRATLDYSGRSRITLQDEVEYIQRYITIENMRFGNKVKFIIHNENNIDLEEIDILPLILQPFIENCFEHAFNEKTIAPQITLSVKETFDFLVLKIVDNGRGLNSFNSSKLYQSKGIKLVVERLLLIQELKNPVQIESTNTGVSVTITLEKQR